MAKLTLDQAVDIRTDFMSNLSISAISDKYQISTDKVRKVLAAEDETSKRLAEENIQIKFDKQTEAIQKYTQVGLQFLMEATESARNSEQPHLFLDKVATAMEKMDKIARLNLNRATDISETRSTHIRMDVAKVMEQLDTPDKRKDFLRKQLTFKSNTNDRDKKNI